MANERVLPNAVSGTNWSGAYTDIDEDVGGSYDGSLFYPTADGQDDGKIDFATPTGNPTAVTDDQQISICVTKILDGTSTEDGGGGDPTYNLWVYDGSSEVQVATAVTVTALDQVHNYSFTYNGASDGSEVYVLIDTLKGGGGPNERWLAVEAIEWNCEVGVATQTVTPAATSATFSTAAPTLVLGEVTLTLGAAAATFSVADPTLAIGEIVLTPDPVVITSSTVTPVVTKGEATTIPDPVSAAWTTVAPTLQIGEVFASPSAVSATFSVPVPTVVEGASLVTLTPAAVTAAFTVPEPQILTGVKCGFLYLNAATGDLYYGEFESSETPVVSTTAVEDTSNEMDTTPVVASLAVDSTDAVHPVWRRASDDDLWRDKITAVTPGTDKELKDGIIAAMVSAGTYSRTGSKYLGYVYVDSTGTKFDEVSLEDVTTVTPDTVVATFSTAAPTLVVGEVTLTPSSVVATFSTAAPTLVIGDITLTLSPVIATFSTAAPIVVEGEVILTLAAVSATFSTAAPTVVVGEVTLTPAPTVATFSTAAVVIDVVVAPAAVVATFNIPAPFVISGTGVAPDPVVATFSVVTPSVTYDATVTPTPVAITLSTAAPVVTYDVTVTPTPVVATFSVPTVITSVVVAPSPVVAAFNATLDAPTDDGIYTPTQYTSASRPAEFGTFIDELSGAIITRLTDAIGESKLRIGPDYPTGAAINKNSTRMLLKVNGGEWWQYDIDGTYVRTMYSSNDFRWSKLYNDVAYYCTGAQLRSFDATTGGTALVHTFSGTINLAGGSQDLSNNDIVVINDSGTTLRLYDIENDTVLGSETAAVAAYDHATVASDGSGFIINWNANGASRYQGVEFYDDTATFARQLTQNGAHGDMTLDSSGNPFWVQVNQVGTGDPSEPLGGKSIYKADLSTGTKTLLLDGIPTALSMHMSGRSCDGWLYPSFYDWTDSGLPGWYKMKNEIIRVKMDGSYYFQRLCHHRSRGTSYYATPMAQPSPDGTLVVWHSDWMDTTLGDYHDTYIFSLIGDGPAPTLVLGPISVSPTSVVAVFSTGIPTLVVGEVTLTPTPVVATFTAPDPVIVTGGLTTLTPSPVAATFSTAAPTVVLGEVTLTPAPVVATFSASVPTVSIGIILSPDAAVATFSVPSVIIDVVVAPAPVVATFSTVAPTIAAGGSILTPSAVSATFSTVAPTVQIGTVTLTPAAVVATFSTVAPALSVGEVTLTPSSVAATFSIGDVNTVYTVTSDAVIITLSTTALSLVLGEVTLSPDPVVATFAAVTPLVESNLITPTPVVVTFILPTPTVFQAKRLTFRLSVEGDDVYTFELQVVDSTQTFKSDVEEDDVYTFELEGV